MRALFLEVIMETSFEIRRNFLIIHLQGELDHHMAELIRLQSDTYLEGTRIKHVIFDFQGTSFMDSSGIGVIMGRYKQVTRMGGSVYVVHANSAIKRIILLSGLHKLLKQCDDVETAIALEEV